MMKAVRKSLQLIMVALFALFALFALIATIAAIHFPYSVDAPLTPQEIEAAQRYYTDAYKKPPESQGSSEYETK